MFDSRIKDLIDGLDVKIKCSSELDVEGTYLASLNWIIINSNLSEAKQYEVLLHKLGHASLQRGETELYHTTYASHAKMEAAANKFMLKEEVESYLTEHGKDDFSAVKFLERYNLPLNYEPLVLDVVAGM